MALSDYKYTAIILILLFVYLQFFHNSQHNPNSRFEVSNDQVVFHSNWTKSVEDLCCLGKLHDALSLDGPKTLDFSLSMSSSLNDQDVANIFAVSKLSPYTNIKIDLSGLNITQQGIDHVVSLIQTQNLQYLELHLNGLTTKPGFGKYLAEKLNRFTQLKSLQISLIMSLKEKEVSEFIANHKPRDVLKSFHFIVMGNEITKEGFSGLEQYMSQLSLNELNLNLYANKLGAEGAEVVSNALKTQKALKDLHLDLYFNNITEVGTENITAVLQGMQTLKSLELNLDFNYIKNEGGKTVGKMLEKMTNLESLSIGVASKNFGYLGFKYVVSGLQKLTQLKKLVFRCGVNRVGYNGAEITKEMLSQMTQLEHLELGFIENYVGDDGIGLIAEHVASMKTLKRVSLNLAFNDAKSYGLIKTIKSFLNRNFESLHLNLGHNEFRDNDVKLIENHLATLISKNEDFTLDFTDTAISKTQMKALQKVFTDANKKFGKNAKISVNSIIPDEEEEKPAPNETKPEQKEAKTEQKEAKTQQKQTKPQQKETVTQNKTANAQNKEL